MTLSRARALCATSRKQIGVAALSGAERVTRLAQGHGTSRKFVRAQRELVRQAVDLAFAEPTAPLLVEPFPRVSDAWVRRFVLGVVLIVLGSYRQVVELLRGPEREDRCVAGRRMQRPEGRLASGSSDTRNTEV